jgi:hypothetical protein
VLLECLLVRGLMHVNTAGRGVGFFAVIYSGLGASLFVV